MPRRRKKGYKAKFRAVLELAPSLALEVMVTDFEEAVWRVAAHALPDIAATSISARPFSDRLANLAWNEPTANRASSRTTSNCCLRCHICQRSILGPRSTGSLKEPMTPWNPWSHMSTNSGSTSSPQKTGACTARQHVRTMTLKVGTTDSTWRPAVPTWISMSSCDYWKGRPTWCHCSVNCWRRTR